MVERPSRAASRAAVTPANPPPTTMTSYRSLPTSGTNVPLPARRGQTPLGGSRARGEAGAGRQAPVEPEHRRPGGGGGKGAGRERERRRQVQPPRPQGGRERQPCPPR